MMSSLWIAKTGMTAQQTGLDVIAHNLANLSTTGFKRNRAEFQDLMYQNLRQVGGQSSAENRLPSGMHLGLGVNVGTITREFRQGTLEKTDNDFDMAINGDGFFQITMPDGSTAYTRDGNFTLDAQGRMVTASGGYLSLDGVTKVSGAVKAKVGKDGSVEFFDRNADKIGGGGKLNLAVFINPEGLEPIGENLFRRTDSSGDPEVGDYLTGGAFGVIEQGFLENSNVNPVTELITMIQTQRAYEMNSKAVQTADQMLAKLGQL